MDVGCSNDQWRFQLFQQCNWRGKERLENQTFKYSKRLTSGQKVSTVESFVVIVVNTYKAK